MPEFARYQTSQQILHQLGAELYLYCRQSLVLLYSNSRSRVDKTRLLEFILALLLMEALILSSAL
jgi:hypothetical protein